MQRILSKLLIISLLAILHLSCQQREVYFRYADVANKEWSKADTLCFQIDSLLIDTNQIYDISFELKHNVQYPYQNIWLSVVDQLSDSVEAKSLQYLIADDYGAWQGAGFGSVYQISLAYKNGVSFSGIRNRQLKVVHKMRDDYLVGVENLGLKISKSE